MSNELLRKKCVSCEGGVLPLDKPQAELLLQSLDGWTLLDDVSALHKHFTFNNFDQTEMFVKQIMAIAVEQNHHPDVTFGYNYCDITFTTHTIHGLSENDFICAAHIDNCDHRETK